MFAVFLSLIMPGEERKEVEASVPLRRGALYVSDGVNDQSSTHGDSLPCLLSSSSLSSLPYLWLFAACARLHSRPICLLVSIALSLLCWSIGLSVIAIRRIAEAACLLLSLPVHLLLVSSSSISRHASGGVHGENDKQEEKRERRSNYYSSFEDVWNDRRMSSHLTAASIGSHVNKPSRPPARGIVSFLSSAASCEQREVLASLVLHIKEDWCRTIIDCMRVLRNYLQILSEQHHPGSCGDEGRGGRLQDRRWRGLVTFEVEAVDALAYLGELEEKGMKRYR